MGVEPPFLYDHPSKYSFVGPTEKGFNPKAATQASWSPTRAKAKPDGPLINSKEFNRHPDSYFVVPYGNLDSKPMSPRTKSKVKWTRLAQLFLRICELLGAAGMLFCGICLKGVDVYATYHLSRSSKGRTPASSASYMLFASFLDVGLMPFLVFSALISHTQSIEPNNAPGHWTTLFGSDQATTKIVYSTFLVSLTNGCMHLVSLIISIYLGVIFRKISQLPPDMNPLEDNLTSRHKRNKSSLLDNRMSQATTATANSQTNSKAEDPLISPPRTLPFMHTRNSSHDNITNVPHPNFSPKVSRTDLAAPFYDQPPAHRSSRTEIQGPFYNQPVSQRSSRIKLQSQYHDSPPSHRSLRTHFHDISLDQNSPRQMEEIPPKPITQTSITRSPAKSSSIHSSSTITTIASNRPRSAAPSLPDSNWITHPSPSPSPSPPRELKHLRNKSSYQPLSQTSPFEYTNQDENMIPRPLEMNPPTPPIQQQKRRQNIEQRALVPGTGNVGGQGTWGSGTVGLGKARAWGGMGRTGGGMGGGGRVVSRSGVEIREGGIFPSGGVRAREVSGKVMEEGRGTGGGWL
ncbi:hypothetical protein OEA41_007843 [Lepraria neglecta]|uniref:Uncharacterized protein n=1 Tax=Lepraria neglecta TaxID=209136 RepID=A0AAE0DQQ0_9LECA|nr:hypothetical protein OEA41_007843 [Lepraria neglecta]